MFKYLHQEHLTMFVHHAWLRACRAGWVGAGTYELPGGMGVAPPPPPSSARRRSPMQSYRYGKAKPDMDPTL